MRCLISSPQNKIIVLFLMAFPIFSAITRIVFAEEALTWQDCIAEAGKNHPDLISAEEVINQDKAAKKITASGLLPQVDASLGAATRKTTTETASGAAVSSTSDSYSYGVTGAQLIFDGFKTIHNINSATENIKASQQAYRFASSRVRLALRTAFISLLRAQELINVAEEIVKIRRQSLILITLRYYSGLEHKGALLTAEANLALAEYDLSQAKRAIETAQRQMTKEMGRKGFRPILVKGDFTVQEAAQEKPDLEKLVQANPSLLQAGAQKNSAAFGIRSAYANFSPGLSGSAGAGKSSSGWPPDSNQWNLGLTLSLPLFEGGLRSAQLFQAKALYRQLEEDERSLRDGIVVNLQQAWASLQDALQTVDVQAKILEAAQERSKIAAAQYSAGFVTFDNWIIIENNLVTAKRTHLEDKAQALLAEADWIQAKGETLEYAQ